MSNAGSIFTSHERALANAHWNTSTARLNRDSFLTFGSCSLCLNSAREPVSCQRGDVFCRECALSNILSQKKELKRAEKAKKQTADDDARRREELDAEDRERSVRDFELTQAGFKVTGRKSKEVEDADGKKKWAAVKELKLLEAAPARETPEKDGKEIATAGENGGSKRKFELDQEDLDKAAQEDRSKARKALDHEKASKSSLPSFWTPSLTPDVHDSKHGAPIKKHKSTPTCPASAQDHPHHLSLNKLITIQFDQDVDVSTKETRMTCPSCRKALSNALAPVMAKRCGHVLCQKCARQFMMPSGKNKTADEIIGCYVCEEPVAVSSSERDIGSGLPTGLVALRSEGTGFSSKGNSTVGKTGIAFQC